MRHWKTLALAGIGSCIALVISLHRVPASYALDGVTSRSVRPTVAATIPGDRSRNPKKKLHYGWQSDGSGGWVRCSSSWPTRKPMPITLTAIRTSTGGLDFQKLPTEAWALFLDASNACFMDDDDPEGPTHPVAKEGQSQEGTFPQTGGADGRIEVRARAEVPKMDPNADLKAGQGYFVADYYNSGATNFTNSALKVTIMPKHSVLVWFGKDDKSNIYSAVVDLASFPNDPMGDFSSARVVNSGQLCATTLQDSDKRGIGFARFKEPKHQLPPVATTCNKIPDETWVNCTPGCCMVTGFTLFPASMKVSPRMGKERRM